MNAAGSPTRVIGTTDFITRSPSTWRASCFQLNRWKMQNSILHPIDFVSKVLIGSGCSRQQDSIPPGRDIEAEGFGWCWLRRSPGAARHPPRGISGSNQTLMRTRVGNPCRTFVEARSASASVPRSRSLLVCVSAPLPWRTTNASACPLPSVALAPLLPFFCVFGFSRCLTPDTAASNGDNSSFSVVSLRLQQPATRVLSSLPRFD